jgi:hypothetical protein
LLDAGFARTGEQNAEDARDCVTQHEIRASPEDDATVNGRFTEELLNLDAELTLVPVRGVDRRVVRWRDPRQVRQDPADAAARCTVTDRAARVVICCLVLFDAAPSRVDATRLRR